MDRIAVIGAGAFGTALALVAARAGADVTLWTRDPNQARDISAARENRRHLAGIPIPEEIRPTADISALGNAELVLLAVPAQATRDVARDFAAKIPRGIPVLACAKGIERETGALQTDIISECLPEARPAALSGPGFADEIARGLPTAVTIAAGDIALAHDICAALSTDTFRPYASDDLVGVELGGSIKNVLAIACGIVAGRGLGESARAALISRGLAEMTRLGTALGADAQTFMGLSGLGDLVLTATSGHSRNLSFGVALGQGRTVSDLLAAGAPLAEGAHTARIAADLARRHGVDAPITGAVAGIIHGRVTVDEAIEGLVRRPLKAENA
jgi:glycerol-3-phosphate dehydrogenase (NAD(P)+)